MKTVVTHIGPDLDAIASVWLVKTFLEGWEEASIAFVPAGSTLNDMDPDSDPKIMHVDTGFGKFDHHQTSDYTCGAKRVYEHIAQELEPDPALERIVDVVNAFDHFRDAFYPEAEADYWEFNLAYLINGWRLIYADDPLKIMSLGMDSLDGLYKTMQSKIWAEKELTEGIEFETQWGKGIGLETINDDVMRLGQKQGYAVVVRKDPKRGNLRIKSQPRDDIDLTKHYEVLEKQEPEASWFLHASRHMILNGSSKNPKMKPSSRPLSEIIEELKKKR